MADATKLTLPIAAVAAIIATAIGGALAYSGLTGGIAALGDRLGRVEARLGAVEVNTNGVVQQQFDLRQLHAIISERQAAQADRMMGMEARILGLEGWQRNVLARPTP